MGLISIYTDFIADFEAKLDPLKLAQIGMVVVEKFTAPEEAIAFVEKIQGLVKGKIDEVAGSVSLTWVQPRVLDATQLESMLQKIGGWVSSVGSMEVLIENKAGEILTY